jgi:hypothetical protein
MRKFLVTGVLAALTLAGCATAPFGNYSNAPASYEQGIVADMVTKLSTDYPPARTRLNLEQATPDALGVRLIASLRAKGFAVAELNKPESAEEGNARDAVRRAAHPFFFRAPAPAQTTVDMRYVVDQVGIDNLYRVTIWLGDKSLSRAYLAQGDSVTPAGMWVRKE